MDFDAYKVLAFNTMNCLTRKKGHKMQMKNILPELCAEWLDIPSHKLGQSDNLGACKKCYAIS